MSEASIAQVAQKMQTILTTVARQAGFESKFIERQRTLTAEAFVQGLTLAWLQNPDSTLEQLAQSVTAAGSPITAQGLDERFTESAAVFLQYVLETAAMQLIAADPQVLPLLRRFSGVYLHDSSTITLPPELACYWRGCGGKKGETAALKIQIQLNLGTGGLVGPVLQAGREVDRGSTLYSQEFPDGALTLNDLGYFKLSVFSRQAKGGAFFLSRLFLGTNLLTPEGRKLELLDFLMTQTESSVDRPVLIGSDEKVPARLLVVRVPVEVAEERRRRLKLDARRKQITPSRRRLALCDWTMLVTNVPLEKLQMFEALELYRARWQVELLFRLWKKYAKIDRSRSQKPLRQLCEVYAKLLGVLIQHWILVLGCWSFWNRSLEKAAQTVRSYGKALLLALGEIPSLCQVLSSIIQALQKGCRINKSRKHPHTWQILLALDSQFDSDVSSSPTLT